MAVTLDATGTALSTAVGTTSLSYTGITVGTGPNRALVVSVNLAPNTVTNVVATWDNGGTNQVMSNLVTINDPFSGYTALFGLLSPTSGNKTLAVTWTGSAVYVVNAISFTGVIQTSNALAFPNTTANKDSVGASSQSIVLNLSNPGSDYALGVACLAGNTVVNSRSDTLWFDNNSSAVMKADGQSVAGASSPHTFSWTLNAGDQAAKVAVEISSGVNTSCGITGFGTTTW